MNLPLSSLLRVHGAHVARRALMRAQPQLRCSLGHPAVTPRALHTSLGVETHKFPVRNVRAYYMDDRPGDKRLPHDSGRAVSADALKSLGIFTSHIPVDPRGQWKSEIDAIAGQRGYGNRDVITTASLGDKLEAALEMFYQEHLHEDEEIRYVLAGTGYFDVREHPTDAWVRLQVNAGDFVVLPAGIYHRFTIGTGEFETMRLFKDSPKWIPVPRIPETESNPYRVEYLKSVQRVAGVN